MCQQVEPGLFRPRSWCVSSGLGALAALATLGAGWGFLVLLPIDSSTVWAFLPRWFAWAGIVPLGCAVAARFAAVETERRRPWDSLIIED